VRRFGYRGTVVAGVADIPIGVRAGEQRRNFLVAAVRGSGGDVGIGRNGRPVSEESAVVVLVNPALVGGVENTSTVQKDRFRRRLLWPVG
jgi:hypothetical protein